MAAATPSNSARVDHAATLAAVAELLRGARDSDGVSVFASIHTSPARVECAARDSGEPAFYRLDVAADALWISLVTPARYLSQSIEADLVHTGDKLDDLLADELLDQGYDGPGLHIEHFRDAQRLYTFRARVHAADPAMLARAMLAFEATFRPLGDMTSGGDDQ